MVIWSKQKIEKRTPNKKNFPDKNTDKKNIRYLALIHKKCQPMQITIVKENLVKELYWTSLDFVTLVYYFVVLDAKKASYFLNKLVGDCTVIK